MYHEVKRFSLKALAAQLAAGSNSLPIHPDAARIAFPKGFFHICPPLNLLLINHIGLCLYLLETNSP